MNIYEKLLEVRKEVPYLKKENQGKGLQYSYVSSSQVLGALKLKMDELGLLLIPEIISGKFSDINRKTTSSGSPAVDVLTELEMTFTWVNSEKPDEKLICKWYGQGVDTTGEKGVGKALTYAEKYFMLKFFNIPTDKDDPDSFQEKHDKKQDIPKAKAVTSNKEGGKNSVLTVCSDCGKEIPQAMGENTKKTYGSPLCSSCKSKRKVA